MLVKKDLTQIRGVFKEEIKTLKNDVSKIRKDVDVMLSMFDREYIDLRKRVERIEEHLRLPPLSS